MSQRRCRKRATCRGRSGCFRPAGRQSQPLLPRPGSSAFPSTRSHGRPPPPCLLQPRCRSLRRASFCPLCRPSAASKTEPAASCAQKSEPTSSMGLEPTTFGASNPKTNALPLRQPPDFDSSAEAVVTMLREKPLPLTSLGHPIPLGNKLATRFGQANAKSTAVVLAGSPVVELRSLQQLWDDSDRP